MSKVFLGTCVHLGQPMIEDEKTYGSGYIVQIYLLINFKTSGEMITECSTLQY